MIVNKLDSCFFRYLRLFKVILYNETSDKTLIIPILKIAKQLNHPGINNFFKERNHMSSIGSQLPCAAYTGKEPYLFISYAHVDRKQVYPEIKALYERGYRIWYDEGITPGSEWSEEIAQAINGCDMFIVFISRSAIQSSNVRREISFALNKNKLFLPVHLEEVSLPPGLELSMGNVQWVMKWKMSVDVYTRKLLNALPGSCLGETKQAVAHARPYNAIQKPPIPEGFVFIQGGVFLMGSPENETGRLSIETQHQVKVGDFYMAQYPVTVAQFETFIGEANYRTDADKDGASFLWDGENVNKKSGVNWRCDTKGELQQDKQHPVLHVSWNDAAAYCEWQSKKLNRAFRLPTEAEWEYACRAGTTTPFNTGENLTTGQANYNGNFPYQNYPKGRFIGNTTPVGSYPPNKWGLYDMHGNVWEWCRDWYGEKYYEECKRQGVVDNPKGPATGSNRVFRGGSWDYNARHCRSADRNYNFPGSRNSFIGFRLVFVP
jgi:formylglycine-generating enzyme required for sulfatase activity